MALSHEYGTVCELDAASHVLQCTFNVWMQVNIGGEIRYIKEKWSQDGNYDRHFDLLLSGNHFQVMQIHGFQPINPVTQQPQITPNTNDNASVMTRNNNSQKRKRENNIEQDVEMKCKRNDVTYVHPHPHEETKDIRARRQAMQRKVMAAQRNMDNLPRSQPPIQHHDSDTTEHAEQTRTTTTINNEQVVPDFNKILQNVTLFENEQMAYNFSTCTTCREKRIQLKLTNGQCRRCSLDRATVKLYSPENIMDPGPVPIELQGLTMVEQQLISRISPTINLHLLKHGGMAARGHCATFPQAINQPAQILPKLPQHVEVIKLRRKGKNDTNKEFRVRRYTVQSALHWLQLKNTAYHDITISDEKLALLPLDGQLQDGQILEFDPDTTPSHDLGPAPQQLQTHPKCDVQTDSATMLPEQPVDIRGEVEEAVRSVIGSNHGPVTYDKRNVVTIPWPTRDDHPISKHTTNHFFTMAFPTLFPTGAADFRINRPRTCSSMTEWAEHLIWYQDGRFAQHPYWKFITHNIILRKRSLEQSSFIVRQKLGEDHISVQDLQHMLQNNDDTIPRKILYFASSLRGSPQYWSQRSKELSSLINYNIHEGYGLPSFFTTGSCAEFYFKPLRALMTKYLEKPLSTQSEVYEAITKNSHVVSHYFDLRTQSYFKYVMRNLFGLHTYWYRYEFAPSRGMIHWHGLVWRHDREPHELLYKAIQKELSETETAQELAQWAESVFHMTALHPAGCDADGSPKTDLWPPPEGTAPAIPEEDNPLMKLLSDVAQTQEELINDHLLLTNKINLHVCSDFCWKKNRKGENVCRMEFGTENNPGKPARDVPAIVKDKNGSFRLELTRDHPRLVQHSKIHIQAWRANGDISVILSKSNPSCPDITDIIPVQDYVSGYACKGNQGTGALIDIFKDITSSADTDTSSVSSLCTKLLMQTVKRDVSGVEACHELASLPLYRCSNQFQSVSLSGFRVLERTGSTATKSTPLDKYLTRDANDKSSFYSFICNKGKVPVVNGHTLASFPLTLEYARTMLLLHWPNWRRISDIVGSGEWLQKFKEFLQTDSCPTFVKADVEKASRKANSNPMEDDPSEDHIHDDPDQPEWIDLLQPNAVFDDFTTYFTFDDGGPTFNWSGSYQYPTNVEEHFNSIAQQPDMDDGILNLPEVDPVTLNDEQKFAFNIVMSALVNHKASPTQKKTQDGCSRSSRIRYVISHQLPCPCNMVIFQQKQSCAGISTNW